MSGGVIVWQQYQLYTWRSYWETYQLDAEEIGAKMAEFALSSLASLANINPQQGVQGTQPNLGYSLGVQWNFVIVLAACIGAAHCLLVVAMLWMARPVVVLDDSTLATARLLHGLVGKLDGRGSLCDGKTLAEAIQRTLDSPKGKVVYGIGQRGRNGGGERSGEQSREWSGEWGGEQNGEQSGERVVDMREGLRVRRKLVGKKFPEGPYA